MRAMGVPQSEIDRLREEAKADQPDTFGVLAENWKSFQVFDALGDQWRIVAGFSGAHFQGIDYKALPIVEKRMGVKKRNRARIFNDLRIMAAEAKAILNEKP